MEKFAAAFVTYASIIGMAYGIGQKVDGLLTDEARQKLFRHGHHVVSAAIANVTLITISIMDVALRYRKLGFFWVPSFARSVAFSLLMVLVIAYPLNAIIEASMASNSVARGPLLLFSFFDSPEQFLFIFPTIAMNIAIDYTSFIKTRTLIDRFYSMPSPTRELAIIFCDLLFSLIICLAIGCAGAAILIIAQSDQDNFEVFGSILITIPILVVSFVTSLGIAAVSVIIAANEVACISIRRLENVGLWSLLDFASKPMQASAAVVIVIFTAVYWPTITLIVVT